jgi:hypothetical protein
VWSLLTKLGRKMTDQSSAQDGPTFQFRTYHKIYRVSSTSTSIRHGTQISVA